MSRVRVDSEGRSWTHSKCPKCADPSTHLGIRSDGAFRCLRCGWSGSFGGGGKRLAAPMEDSASPTVPQEATPFALVPPWPKRIAQAWPSVTPSLLLGHCFTLGDCLCFPMRGGGYLRRDFRKGGWLRFCASSALQLTGDPTAQSGSILRLCEGVGDYFGIRSQVAIESQSQPTLILGGSAGVRDATELVSHRTALRELHCYFDRDSAGWKFLGHFVREFLGAVDLVAFVPLGEGKDPASCQGFRSYGISSMSDFLKIPRGTP